MNLEKLTDRLRKPEGMVDVVLDTDTYNEIDDQFALSYLVRSGDRLRLQAVYAAPFFNHHSESPGDGMEKSYREILKILELLEVPEYQTRVYRGSAEYLPDEKTLVDSPAARDLAKRALARSEEEPLYVVAIGAITNVASALLLEPEIKEKIVVVWLGGHALDWHDNREFNMMQDVAAARVVFDSGVPLVLLPCMGVVSSFSVSGPELEYWLKGKNRLCDYLAENTIREAQSVGSEKCWSRVIWDVTAVAWLLDENFMEERLEPRPIPEYDHHWAFDRTRPMMKYVYGIHRDRLLTDLVEKLTKAGK